MKSRKLSHLVKIYWGITLAVIAIASINLLAGGSTFGDVFFMALFIAIVVAIILAVIKKYLNQFPKNQGNNNQLSSQNNQVGRASLRQESKTVVMRLAVGAVSLVVIALIYGAINFVLVGGQKVLKQGDENRLSTLHSELPAEKQSLESLDATIASQEKELAAMKAQLESYASSGQIQSHDALVDPYNSKLSSYKANLTNFNSRVDIYNQKVEEAKKLSESLGSTWVIVPLPNGRSVSN